MTPLEAKMMEDLSATVATLVSRNDHLRLKLSRLGYSEKEIERIEETGWSCMASDRPWGKE